MKIPTLIQEQNSYAGLTNKWLANKVNTICVAYKGMERYFPKEKIIFSGNPVRQDILDISSKRQEALKFFQLTEDKKTILAIGGSLGARTINESLKLHVKKLADANVQVIWQTGSTHYESVKESLEKHNNKNIKAFEFLKNMDLAYAASDLVISRAGALAASELCIVKKPTIFVPSPNVAEDHQTKNANALVNENAAIMIHDNDAKKKLVESALTLLNDSDRMVSLSENIGELGMPQATKTIVDEVDKLIKRN